MRISDWSSDVCSSDLEQVSWDLSFLYALSDEFNVYGRVASGFRAPSIQGRNIAFFDANPFSIAESETILSTEIGRSEEHTSELQSLMRISYAVFCLKKKNNDSEHKTKQNEQHD